MGVEISICIPVYKNIPFLKRLLDSINTQTFRDYEIIITDDSPDDSVKDFLSTYSSNAHIKYFRNQPALGTPENWNEAMRHATGKWIKLMHNDDWFESRYALERFHQETLSYPKHSFFFAAFQNVTEGSGHKEVVRCNSFDLLFLHLSPLHLFRRVYVGNPSCTLIRNNTQLFYDRRFKFVVDFEYYIRVFRTLGNYKYVDEVLLNVGFHDEQVTKYTFLVPDVQLPENIVLLEKLGLGILRNPVVYDYYWRMFRNLRIRSEADVRPYYSGELPLLLGQMIRSQSAVPLKWLNIGVISKSYMLLNYVASLFRRR